MNFAKRIIASSIAIIIISTTVLPSLSIAVDKYYCKGYKIPGEAIDTYIIPYENVGYAGGYGG